ncbi:MAG: hypothetical protein JST85_12900 [Acidobacteria bacterium]|nr:hypothetical protein [Acidobacteriota bacterium]
MAETRTRDLWDKIDILAKIMTPVVLFALGTLYNLHQNGITESQKVADRVTSLVKSLSSDKVDERKAALALLKYERSKNPNAVPNELLSIALPALVQIAKTDPNAEVAQAAQKLAKDVVGNTGVDLAADVKNQVDQEQARVYMHIRNENQRNTARVILEKLARKGLNMPGIELVNFGPTDQTELRFFRKSEEAEANEIAGFLKELNITDAVPKYFPGFENSTSLRSRHYEIWFSPTALRQP